MSNENQNQQADPSILKRLETIEKQQRKTINHQAWGFLVLGGIMMYIIWQFNKQQKSMDAVGSIDGIPEVPVMPPKPSGGAPA